MVAEGGLCQSPDLLQALGDVLKSLCRFSKAAELAENLRKGGSDAMSNGFFSLFPPPGTAITTHSALSTPRGPSGAHGLNARNIRTGNVNSTQTSTQQRSFRSSGRGVNSSPSSSSSSPFSREEDNGGSSYLNGNGIGIGGNVGYKGEGGGGGEGGWIASGGSRQMGSIVGVRGPDGVNAEMLGGVSSCRTVSTSPPRESMASNMERLSLSMAGSTPRPSFRSRDSSNGGFLGPRVEEKSSRGSVSLGVGISQGGKNPNVVSLSGVASIQYPGQPPPPTLVPRSSNFGFGQAKKKELGRKQGGQFPQKKQVSVDGPPSLQQKKIGNDGFSGSYFSASAGSTISPDFNRKRPARMASKFHHGRQRPNTGKHSPQADMATTDLLSLPPSSSEMGLGALQACLDAWIPQLENIEDISYVLRELGNKGEWEKAFMCFKWLATRHEVMGASEVKGASDWGKLASSVISLLGRHGRVEAAREVFERARHNGMGSNVFAYSALLSAHGRSGRCVEALEIFQQMKEEGCRPNLITYNTVIDACGKGGLELDKAWALFEELQREGHTPDRITYNSIMAVCSRAGQWQEAQRVFEDMEKSGIERDIFTFNTLIDALCKVGQMDMAAEAVESMRQKGIHANVVTYNTMIDGYGKAGCVMEALNMYQQMKASGIRPDRVMFNTLLDMYGKVGKIDDALAIRREMEAAGWRTDVVSYNALINMMGKAGRVREASRLFEEMRLSRVKPNVLTWSALIGAYAKAGFHAEAMKCFQDFKKEGLQADVVLYSVLIDVYGKHGLVEEANALLDEMVSRGIQPNIVTYNSLIDAYGRRGQVESAVSTMELMQGIGITPNAVTFNCVIDAFGKEGRAEEALFMLQKMRAAGQSPDSFTFSALIDANGKRGDATSARRIFREMQEAGVKPNVVTFSAILSACSRLSTFEEAAELLAEMKQSDELVYGIARGLLMGEGSSQGVWKQAEIVFDAVEKCDRSTGMAFYNALTDVLWHFGQRAESFRVLQVARSRQVYIRPIWQSEAEGCTVDLHLMSVGAALTMLHSWLLDLRAQAINGRDLPHQLSILTGWGKHSKVAGDSVVKREVDSHLANMESPFRVSKQNEGRIVASGPAVGSWLLRKETENLVFLRDVRGPGTEQVLETKLNPSVEFNRSSEFNSSLELKGGLESNRSSEFN